MLSLSVNLMSVNVFFVGEIFFRKLIAADVNNDKPRGLVASADVLFHGGQRALWQGPLDAAGFMEASAGPRRRVASNCIFLCSACLAGQLVVPRSGKSQTYGKASSLGPQPPGRLLAGAGATAGWGGFISNAL